MSACGNPGAALADGITPPGNTAAANVSSAENGAPRQTEQSDGAGREAILIRGNYWAPGISGFGENSFSALAGEYLLRGNPSGDGEFSVCFTKETLYFSGEWQARPGIQNIPVFQRTGKEGFLAAAISDDSEGSPWTAVFLFPEGLETAGLNAGDFNRMLLAWMHRTSYFLALSKTQADLSLPAVVEF